MTPITVIEYNRLKSMHKRILEKATSIDATNNDRQNEYELRMKLRRYEESTYY